MVGCAMLIIGGLLGLAIMFGIPIYLGIYGYSWTLLILNATVLHFTRNSPAKVAMDFREALTRGGPFRAFWYHVALPVASIFLVQLAIYALAGYFYG